MKERPVGAVPQAATASDLAECDARQAGYELAQRVIITGDAASTIARIESLIASTCEGADPATRVGLLVGLSAGIIAYLKALGQPHHGGWVGEKAGLE